MPRSPLPLPPTPPSARPKVRPARVAAVEYEEEIEFTEAPAQEELEEIQWVDPEEIEASVPQPSHTTTTPVRQKSRPLPTDADSIPEEYDQPPELPAPRPIPKKRPATPAAKVHLELEPAPVNRLTPQNDVEPGKIAVPVRRKRGGDVALVLVAVIFIAAATQYYRSRRAYFQELPRIAEMNTAEGKEALENGRFDEAQVKLNRAAKAYKELGAKDEAATEAIQLSEEAGIYADYTRYTLEEIVEEVARLGEVEGLARFKGFYQGRTVLIETIISSVKNHDVEIVDRVLVGRGPIAAKTGKWDLSNFSLLRNKELKPGDQVTFGGRLDSIRLQGDEWVVTLQPESGVLLTNAKALAIELPSGTSK